MDPAGNNFLLRVASTLLWLLPNQTEGKDAQIQMPSLHFGNKVCPQKNKWTHFEWPHSAELELECMKRSIPFQKRGGLRFFEQAHIKDMTAVLRILNNDKDELAWKRVLCLFQGIGAAKALKIWDWVITTHNPLKHIASHDTQILGSGAPGWTQFKKLSAQLLDATQTPSELINVFLTQFYEGYLKDTYPDFKQRLLDVKQYVNLALQYKSCTSFLEDVLLDADLTAKEEKGIFFSFLRKVRKKEQKLLLLFLFSFSFFFF